ncbi:serine/threonine protein kinase [Candidatus Uabimicrobium amorphum]|uniref:non-specific serine/threonine protein kinase n=1 Tax=Uabimicrobium amorphum TaxID=2596890 RepID=A0A5S9IL13_UABAM|nr:serine/threonine-protein kinase [Candidatus Uabimicrobium amorphum]BBM83396.1 serine/threonine protein kinase [Candidatus Uabimicrobium amorphum]
MDDNIFSRSSLAKVIVEPNSTTEKLKFGHLEILEELGRGAVGVVYKVLQMNLNRIIAVKEMDKSCLSKEDVLRFRTEGKTVAKLKHPNIVRVIDFQETEEAYFLYMDFIDGQTLDVYWQEHRIGWLELADLFIQICDAIHHAHNREIVHRDLKPANVMMSQKGRAYIMDFGLAKVMNNQKRLTKMGAIMGTPEYMPPEQAQGGDIDHRADIYSLGAILYEGLCGQPCFSASTSLALIMKIVREEPIPPKEINPDVPSELQEICLKALSKKREDRYQSAEDMRLDLQNYLNDATEYNKPVMDSCDDADKSQANMRASQASKKRRRVKTKRTRARKNLATSQHGEAENTPPAKPLNKEKVPELSQSQIGDLTPKDMRKIKNSVGRRSRQSRKRHSQKLWQIISLILIVLILILIAKQ